MVEIKPKILSPKNLDVYMHLRIGGVWQSLDFTDDSWIIQLR